MSAKTCGNCGSTVGCKCSRIPANAQSFVRENGQIKVWAVVEDGTCFTCAFGRGWDCTERPCKLLNTDDKHYRIVAVEMVEGE